jgi:hypothetical protein
MAKLTDWQECLKLMSALGGGNSKKILKKAIRTSADRYFNAETAKKVINLFTKAN